MSKMYSLMKQHSEFQNKEEFNTQQQQILTQYQTQINKTDFHWKVKKEKSHAYEA